MNSTLKNIKAQMKSNASETTILGILQDNPCRLKAQNLVQSYSFGNNIDSLYKAIHELAQKEIIDHISNEFGDLIKIKAEDPISYGRLDIRIEFDDSRVTLRDNIKVVAIEIKTGETVKTDHFKQIDRYFLGTDIDALLRIRVVTGEVTVVNNTFEDLLISDIKILNNKGNKIIVETPGIVPGNWCRGCEAKCTYRNPWNNHKHNGSLESYENLKRNIHIVRERTIIKLKELIQSEHDLIQSEHDQVEQDSFDSNNEEEDDSEISNGASSKGETYPKKVSISQLLHPHMYDLSIEGKIESISEPKRVSLRTGDIRQVVDAVFSDQTGSISLSLWDNYSDSVKEGNHIIIEKAYTKEYEGKIILSIGKSGKVVKDPELPSEVSTIKERLSNIGAV